MWHSSTMMLLSIFRQAPAGKISYPIYPNPRLLGCTVSLYLFSLLSSLLPSPLPACLVRVLVPALFAFLFLSLFLSVISFLSIQHKIKTEKKTAFVHLAQLRTGVF